MECGYGHADSELVRLARVRALRITIDFALLAALVVLAVAGLGIGVSHPNSYGPFLTRGSLSNVVLTRAKGSTQPPHASLFAFGPCLVKS